MIQRVSSSELAFFASKFFPDFKKSNNPFLRNIVYKVDNSIVGFISYSVIYERVEIEYIAVIPSYRGKSISDKLFDFVINDSKCDSISLEVRSDNDYAISFYLRKGFKKVSIRKNYYDDVDGILMVKVI